MNKRMRLIILMSLYFNFKVIYTQESFELISVNNLTKMIQEGQIPPLDFKECTKNLLSDEAAFWQHREYYKQYFYIDTKIEEYKHKPYNNLSLIVTHVDNSLRDKPINKIVAAYIVASEFQSHSASCF